MDQYHLYLIVALAWMYFWGGVLSAVILIDPTRANKVEKGTAWIFSVLWFWFVPIVGLHKAWLVFRSFLSRREAPDKKPPARSANHPQA